MTRAAQPQQEFLESAMSALALTPGEFCTRLGCADSTLEKWLLPASSPEFKSMDGTVWALVREILAHEKLKKTAGFKGSISLGS